MATYYSNIDKGFKIRLSVTPGSKNIAKNTTSVNVRLDLLSTSTAYSFSGYSCTAVINIDGRQFNYNSITSIGANTEIMLLNETFSVKHNADGKKDIGFNAIFNGSGGFSPGQLIIETTSITLSRISRVSKVIGETTNIGSVMKIRVEANDPSLRHRLRIGYGKYQNVTIATGIGNRHDWRIPLEYASQMPTSMSSKGTLWCDTYSGNTLIGTSSYIFTLKIPTSFKPELHSITLFDAFPQTQQLYQSETEFVQLLSNIKVDFNCDSDYYTDITAYKAEIVGQSQNVTTKNGGLLGVMNTSGPTVIKAKVRDARGLWSNEVLTNINIVPYIAPSIRITAERGGVNSDEVNLSIYSSVSPLTVGPQQRNSMYLSFSVGEGTNGDLIPDTEITYDTKSVLDGDKVKLTKKYAKDKSYTILARISDSIGVFVGEYRYILSTEQVVFGYDKNGRFGIGAIPTMGPPGSLNVTGNIYVQGALGQNHALTNSDGSTFYAYGNDSPYTGIDLNNVPKNVTLMCRPGVPNWPINGYGFVETIHSETTVNQSAFDLTKPGQYMYFRMGRKSGSVVNWGDWSKITYANTDNPEFTTSDWVSAGVTNSYVRRVGLTLHVKFSFTGTGSSYNIAVIPSSLKTTLSVDSFTMFGSREINTNNIKIQALRNDPNIRALTTVKGIKYEGCIIIPI